MTSLLSQELRHLLNPVWILIKDVRGLPLLSQPPQQARLNDSPGVPAESIGAISPSTTPALGAAAATAAVPAAPAALSSVPASDIKGARDELQARGHSLSQAKNPPEAVSQYFARAHAFRTVLETEPKELSSASTANAIRWNAGFLCFWGPSAADQNELKDFIEERRFRVELHQAAESSGRTDTSESCSNITDVQYREKATGRMPTKPQKAAAGTPSKARRQTAKSQRSAINPAESGGPSSTSPPGYVNYLPASSDATRLRPPLAVASFCLTALSSCMATHLVFCTDVLPFSGHLVGKEGSETSQPRHIKGPEFMESGVRMSIEIRLAEPLFKGDVVERSVPLLLPKQEINRLFLVAPLESRLAKQARQLGEEDKDRCSSVEKLEGNENKVGLATSGEVEAESLTGFLVEDTRLLYGVIEGCANGCLVDAAKLLLRVMKEEKGSGSRLLYNSCLRFTDRRYSVASLAQTIDLRTPLGELVTCRALFDKNNAAALPVLSGLSKLQMATLFTRAADLKCQDLFPTAEELQSIGEFVSKQK
ncbi:hypothetical protein ENH_00057850 [Eimeria necatrix]|uniref:Uncharacterized protein n=1 Tax=Eimeria necatrix TaxID=51315 RepID=U6N451_9EIME|nr:hypothetical protein ENH_00057850 [Eimeria necatrix]CDJ68715.1 hypothetical protein ENH_00057850 [Eimeria necatrix]